MKVLSSKEFWFNVENHAIEFFQKDGVLNLEEVINTYNSYIYRILNNKISNKSDIEEILSDVFLIFWKNYKKLASDTKVKPYLVGIAKNLVKKKYGEHHIDFDDIELYENDVTCDVDIVQIVENREKAKIISNTLNELKEADRNIFIMFYYHQKKIREIAKIFNSSESRVKIILHRVRKVIKKKLKERGYNYGK